MLESKVSSLKMSGGKTQRGAIAEDFLMYVAMSDSNSVC